MGSLLLIACGTTHESERSSNSAGTPPSGSLDRTAIDVAMERVRPLVSACVDPARRGETWNVDLTIRNDGRPTDVHVEGEQQGDPTVAACLEGAVSGALFPPFAGGPVTIRYPYYIR
ncbi:MAG: hypothetical protein ACXVDD_16685 [Polyangia bacterium]